MTGLGWLLKDVVDMRRDGDNLGAALWLVMIVTQSAAMLILGGMIVVALFVLPWLLVPVGVLGGAGWFLWRLCEPRDDS